MITATEKKTINLTFLSRSECRYIMLICINKSSTDMKKTKKMKSHYVNVNYYTCSQGGSLLKRFNDASEPF